MKAITLHAPWGTLLHTRTSCDCPMSRAPVYLPTTKPSDHMLGCAYRSTPMVKRFETRSWPCPPSIIGQRVAFHQAKRPMRLPELRALGVGTYGSLANPPRLKFSNGLDVSVPLGCIVASGVITRSLPIQRCSDHEAHICATVNGLLLHEPLTFTGSRIGETEEDITDQFLYGDWSSGRWAWELSDVAATTDQCPWCAGFGNVVDRDDPDHDCPFCHGEGKCEPIPARGKQGWWTWNPT